MPTNPVIWRRPSGSSLNSLALPAVTLKKQSAGSPSLMNVRPAGASVTTATAARRARSASSIALQTLSGLATQVMTRVDPSFRIENDRMREPSWP